jgi:hypothetical protein
VPLRNTESVFIVRGTKKFRDRVDGPLPAQGESQSNVLGDWFATALFWRPQVALFVSEATLLPVLLPLAPAATVVRRFPEALRALVDSLGFGSWFDEFEAPEMAEFRIDRTNSRSVLGSMNDFAFQCDVYRHGPNSADLLTLSRQLAHTPCSPLYSRTGFPDLELARIVNGS